MTRTPSSNIALGSDLLSLRSQLARAEKAARRSAKEPAPAPSSKSVKPQRESDLAGISTDEYLLTHAHSRLRGAVYDGHYQLCAHAVQHARAQGFLEHDIMAVLTSGRVRAVYPEDSRWLVAGYFEVQQVKLPLHVVVELHHIFTPLGKAEYLDIVTAFVPKNPHHIISRARLAVMLRYDDGDIKHRLSSAGNKVGYKSKGRWR